MTRQFTPKPHTTEPAHAIYVVAADAGRARIFVAKSENSHMTELADFLNPRSRQQDHDALSDRKGSITQGSAGITHAFEPRQSHAEHSAEVFAKEVCEFLHKASAAGEVDRIYLIAAPNFLGLLRKNLEPSTLKHVVKEMASDIARMPPADIRQTLPHIL